MQVFKLISEFENPSQTIRCRCALFRAYLLSFIAFPLVRLRFWRNERQIKDQIKPIVWPLPDVFMRTFARVAYLEILQSGYCMLATFFSANAKSGILLGRPSWPYAMHIMHRLHLIQSLKFSDWVAVDALQSLDWPVQPFPHLSSHRRSSVHHWSLGDLPLPVNTLRAAVE